ncbi:hypothetical protein MtrunA17_Chr7g0235931 [Medicago truncatula]|uniref:Uncharacterized protein n=1 Tax=Medicago truncatula TaxID=3880 RepID=A0A396GXJ3_MEDTR|nr:mediator of RNA polymerase II transcription subunit 33A isoform X1 [Medicago truncatula]RHN45849.1 hypothetical protein MtrunA17_Chr7g0235931 [Medicago truncatula]
MRYFQSFAGKLSNLEAWRRSKRSTRLQYMVQMKRRFLPLPFWDGGMHRIMESIDNVLQLSQEYSHNVCEPGVALVEFVFSILRQLLEATLDDEGLLDHLARWLSISHDMDIDEHVRINEMTTEQKEVMRRKNTTLAIEIIVNFLQNKMTSRLLSLVHRNMPSYWRSFKHQMQLIASKSSILKNLTHINADTLLSAMENIHGVVSCNAKSVIPAGSQVAFDGALPIDLILEDALDGGHVATFSAIEMITVGNLRHLIVEACIARNLLDTSAYYWPGYVNACSNQIPASISNQVDGWSSLMKGSKLTPTLADFLAATPASSLAEIEKIYEIAIYGSDEEKISAATIMCGASLARGWNAQVITWTDPKILNSGGMTKNV